MKQNFCSIEYDRKTKCWNCIIETSYLRDFYIFKSKERCKKFCEFLCIKHKVTLYIFDKKYTVEEKRIYNNL